MDALWNNLMTLQHRSLLEKVLRPIAIYVFLVVGLRLAGKRELGQFTPFDLVVLLTLSNTVQNAIIGDDNSLLGGIIGAVTLLTANYLVVRWVYHHPRIEKIIEGSPVALIEHGKVRDERLADELVTRAELESAARRQGFSALDEVDQAILEAGGSLTFFPKKHHPRQTRHHELVARLDQIARELGDLRAALVKVEKP